MHYIKPRRQGGSNRLSNLEPLCGRCHDYRSSSCICTQTGFWYQTIRYTCCSTENT
ncbi:hypothetical protein C6497_10205 [Candidatus Poribacteria bacterium]|nr:MAG: hypothetical protein C6497_10205 [Candidatus Poribacteria bacterium]